MKQVVSPCATVSANMRAVIISTCVALLVTIASASPEEGSTIHITGPVTLIIGSPGDVSTQEGHEVPTAEQCTDEDGFCVEPGDRCDGTVKMVYNSCNDHCTCCVPDKQAGWCEFPGKLIGNECIFISSVLEDAETARQICLNAAVEHNIPLSQAQGFCENAKPVTEKIWSDALQFCKEIGGYLAEPSDVEALRGIMTDGVLYWVGSKNDESQGCSIMHDLEGSVGFDVHDCETAQSWICEKSNPNVASSNN